MPFHPQGAPVPDGLRAWRLLLRPLLTADVDRDYAAVMWDPAALRRWSQSDWPADDFTLAENLADLVRHEQEHRDGVAFTFTVLNPEGAHCLGCVYLTPIFDEVARLCDRADYPVQMGFWVRSSEIHSDLDRHLLETLRHWLKTAWQFDCVVLAISARDERQLSIVRDALGPGVPVTLADGRECVAFVERMQRVG